MASPEKVSSMQFDWSAAPEVPLRPANVCVVQAMPDGHVINFGFVPPVLNPTPTTKPQDVAVEVVARLVLSPATADSLLEALQSNIVRRHQIAEEVAAQERQEKRSDA